MRRAVRDYRRRRRATARSEKMGGDTVVATVPLPRVLPKNRSLSPRGKGMNFGSRPVSPHKNKPNKERTSRDFFDQKGIYARWEFEKLYNCQRRVTPSLFNRSSSVA